MEYRSCCPKQGRGHWLMLHQRGEHLVLSLIQLTSLCRKHLPGKQLHPPSQEKDFDVKTQKYNTVQEKPNKKQSDTAILKVTVSIVKNDK